MKNQKKTVVGAVALLALSLAMPQTASANETQSNLEDEVAAIIGAEIQADVDPNEAGIISFGTPDVTVTAQTANEFNNDPEAIADAFFQGVQDELAESPEPTPPPLTTFGTGTYVADQNVTVPSLGIAWIAQKLNYNISGSYINSLSKSGSSYMYGIALGTWSHNSTTTTLKRSRTCVATQMSGVFRYTVNGVGIHLPANVLASDAASGGGLHSVTYHDC
ncbi:MULTISPECIES: hypothetical protein [unclassified Microbacterium]|uniref:hypothetical protein n=1 Tax=unclassified Microbacterium TaxID=2609290 RepID=UPI000EA8BA43|nr:MULTISPECIES: hypothetical protein [unclassified Microbacterium]MBT2486449.1 hypothetical protein [Microbacterium sp. ISL-108]RKN69148.1 hypothetical protein D7252_17255 [Microbacterium sp. CGR2]